MKYKVIGLFFLLSFLLSCSKEYGKLSNALGFAHQGIQNIQAAYETAQFIQENIIKSNKVADPREKERLLEDYRNALELSNSNFNQALAIYQDIIQKKPEDAFILNSLAHTYMWLNQRDKADKYFDLALKSCQSSSLKESIEYNKGYFPEVEKYYTLFQEVDKLRKGGTLSP